NGTADRCPLSPCPCYSPPLASGRTGRDGHGRARDPPIRRVRRGVHRRPPALLRAQSPSAVHGRVPVGERAAVSGHRTVSLGTRLRRPSANLFVLSTDDAWVTAAAASGYPLGKGAV